jgi:hypothetical protein
LERSDDATSDDMPQLSKFLKLLLGFPMLESLDIVDRVPELDPSEEKEVSEIDHSLGEIDKTHKPPVEFVMKFEQSFP